MSTRAIIEPYRTTVAMAAEDFDQILTQQGILKACQYSEVAEEKAGTLDQAIYAIAFDFAAMTVDQGVSESSGTKPQKRFFPDRVLSRAKRRLLAMDCPKSEVDDMLKELLIAVRASLMALVAQRKKP